MNWQDMILEIMKWIEDGSAEHLSDWETEFAADINEKYEEFDNFEPTPLQGEKIEEIYNKEE